MLLTYRTCPANAPLSSESPIFSAASEAVPLRLTDQVLQQPLVIGTPIRGPGFFLTRNRLPLLLRDKTSLLASPNAPVRVQALQNELSGRGGHARAFLWSNSQ